MDGCLVLFTPQLTPYLKFGHQLVVDQKFLSPISLTGVRRTKVQLDLRHRSFIPQLLLLLPRFQSERSRLTPKEFEPLAHHVIRHTSAVL